jgi:polysaccharide export outer membrane protein
MATRHFRSRLLGLALAALALPALARAQVNPRVAPRDQLVITVVNLAEWSKAYPVGADGMIEFPEIGRIKVDGLTAREVESAIEKSLRDGRIHTNPQITVEVQQTPNKKVSIFGPVRNPGVIAYAGEITLLDVIGRAGGRGVDAADDVLVIRMATDGSATEPIRVNVREIESGDLAHNLTLQDGDQILVLKAQAVFVSGEVRNQGPINAEAGMTVWQAITMAGGLTERGAKNRIQIRRIVDGEPKTIKVKETDPIKPGDTIIVGRRIL